MLKMNYLQDNFHSLNTLLDGELNVALDNIQEKLANNHLTSIINAFLNNTIIFENGTPYIKIKGINSILRTSSSKLERVLIYQGVLNILSPPPIIIYCGDEYISGPSLIQLIYYRISCTNGITKFYLEYSLKCYNEIINSSKVRDLKDYFLGNIQKYRSQLKKERIAKYHIQHCEFTGKIFSDESEVEFAHIDSVALNPLKALDPDNGVIIFKSIHATMTALGLHSAQDMYNFCTSKDYSTNWSNFSSR